MLLSAINLPNLKPSMNQQMNHNYRKINEYKIAKNVERNRIYLRLDTFEL